MTSDCHVCHMRLAQTGASEQFCEDKFQDKFSQLFKKNLWKLI